MNKSSWNAAWLMLLVLAVSGCDLVGDVLEFGFWTILILVLLVALLIYVIIKKIFD